MDVRTRIQICRLIEKINSNPKFAEKIFVEYVDKTQMHVDRERDKNEL